MGKGVTDSSTVVRYPDYIEEHHHDILNDAEAARDGAVAADPYAQYSSISDAVETAFFGVGYTIASFPSLYDMYGKFMAGLDIEVLFDEIFEDSTDGPIINNLVSVHASKLSDDIEQQVLPRFVAGLRDINSVLSSTFIVGKAMLEAQRIKEVSQFDAQTRYNMIPVAVDRWKEHLLWNKDVIETYMKIMMQYVDTNSKLQGMDMDADMKSAMWTLEVLTAEAKLIGALSGVKAGADEQIPLWRHLASLALGIGGMIASDKRMKYGIRYL